MTLFFLVIPVAVILIVFLFAFLRRQREMALRGPRRRHIITRIVCGALGAGILITLAVGTWRDVNNSYNPPPVAAMTIHAPTLPPPAGSITTAFASGPGKPVKQARLLVQLAIVDLLAPSQLVHLEEFQINWPEAKGRTKAISFTLGHRDVNFEIRIDGVTASNAHLYDVSGSIKFEAKSSNTYCGKECGVQIGMNRLNYQLDDERGFLSLAGPQKQWLGDIAFVTPLTLDDPLKEISTEQFTATHKDEIAEISRDYGGRDMLITVMHADDLPNETSIPALGIAFFRHIELACLLLLAAAILLTQLFTQRGLAFAGVLTAVILYAAAADRLVLSANISHLNNANAPVAERITAANQAAMSFFYRTTASRDLQAVADDSANPPDLKIAARMAETLRDGR